MRDFGHTVCTYFVRRTGECSNFVPPTATRLGLVLPDVCRVRPCDNCRAYYLSITYEHTRMMQMSQTRRALIWTAMALIAALLCLWGFRGYLSMEMLLNFANAFYC